MSRDVPSCTQWLRPRDPPPSSPRICIRIRGRYWTAKIDDISLWPPDHYGCWNSKSLFKCYAACATGRSQCFSLYAKNKTEHNLNIEQKNQSTCDLLKTALMNGFDKFYRFFHHSSIWNKKKVRVSPTLKHIFRQYAKSSAKYPALGNNPAFFCV